MSYLKCEFVKDYEKETPIYNTDSVSEMREALKYYEDVVSDIDSKMDDVFDFFKDYIKKSSSYNEEEVREYLESVSCQRYQGPRQNGIGWLLGEVVNGINKEKYPEQWKERQNKIREDKYKSDKLKQEKLNEYLCYFLDK